MKKYLILVFKKKKKKKVIQLKFFLNSLDGKFDKKNGSDISAP